MISHYLTTCIIKISSRTCTVPKTVLILIIHDIHQNFNCSLTEENCSLTEKKCSLTEGCSLTEEEIKRKNRDGKNIDSLPPIPSIIDTRKGEKNIDHKKEKKRRKKSAASSARARGKNFGFGK
jgi:hypothetical protein